MPNHPSSLFHFAMCGLSASRTILPAGLAGVSGHGLALSPGGAHVIGSLPSEVAHGKRLRTCERSRNEPSPDRRGLLGSVFICGDNLHRHRLRRRPRAPEGNHGKAGWLWRDPPSAASWSIRYILAVRLRGRTPLNPSPSFSRSGYLPASAFLPC